MQRRVAQSFALAVMLTTFIWTVSASAAVWYVDSHVEQSGIGATWATGFKTVKEGINTAQNGDEVRVAQGFYDENIVVSKSVSIYGGYIAGTSNRIFFSDNGSVLDGGGRSAVVTIGVNSTRIDGFIIRNGNGLNGNGGGINCSASNVTIANNTITGNTAQNFGGGGIFLSNCTSTSIINNIITANTASYYGGGIEIDSGGVSSILVANNIISGNSSGLYGGGISGGNVFSIRNNTITGNSAVTGGGIYFPPSNTNPTISNNIVAFNSSGIASLNPYLYWSIYNNDVYGNTGGNYVNIGVDEGMNMSLNPEFVDIVAGDYHLTAGSPCINAGNNTLVLEGWTDIDGEGRINLSDGAGTVDIGADEYYADTTPPAVTDTYPLEGAIDVTVNQVITIRVTFSEGVQVIPPASNIFLYDNKRLQLVSTTTPQVNGKDLTFTPVDQNGTPIYLNKNTTYTVTIPLFSIQDLAGNEMLTDKIFYFTTVKR